MRLYLKTIVILFGIFSYSSIFSKSHILEARLNTYPHVGGSFKSENETFYYMIGGRIITILNSSFVMIQNFQASPGASLIDFGDINGDGNDDIVEIRRNDILVIYQSENGLFRNSIRLTTGDFISPPGTQRIEQVSFLHDVNHDGFSEITIPSESHYIYFENDHGTLVPSLTLECPYESTYSDRYWSNSDLRANRLLLRTSIPSVYFQDINGDGIDDAYCRFKTIVYYYLSEKNNKGKLLPLVKKVIKSYPANLQREYASSFVLKDLDSDGYLDAVFSIVSGLGIKIKTDVQIFWGKSTLPDSADFLKWTVDGGFFTPLFLENNGRTQLLIPALDLGVSFFLSYVLEKRMHIEGNIYSIINHKEIRKIDSHELSFQVLDNYFPGFTSGDFNLDGITDVVIADNLNELKIYYGSEDMKGKDTLIIPLPGYGIIETIPSLSHKNELLIYLPQKVPGYNSQMVYLVRFD